jgi:hypothetical protein
MIEPVSLGVIAAALAAKVWDRAGDEVAEAGVGAMRRLAGTLRAWFKRDDDEEGLRALERVEDAPDSPSRQAELAMVVDVRAAQSNEFRLAVEGLIQEAQKAGVEVDSIVQTAIGSQNVQNAGLVDSEVTVRQDGSWSPRD